MGSEAVRVDEKRTEPPRPAPPPARRPVRRRRPRRAAPPSSLAVEVSLSSDSTFFAGFDGSFGSGGLFVASVETLPVGHELDLVVRLESRTLRARGRVVFVRDDALANPDCAAGAGIVLSGLGSDDVRAVESFLKQRAPMFWVPLPATAFGG